MVIILSDEKFPTMKDLGRWLRKSNKKKPEGFDKWAWAEIKAGMAAGLGLDELQAFIAAYGREFTDWLGITPSKAGKK